MLLDTDNNGRYDIVFVTEYSDIVVEEVTSTNKIIDKYGRPTLKLDDENDDLIYSITLGGEELKLSELSEYDVLSVAESKDKLLYEIRVSRDSVEGKVTGIDEEGYDSCSARRVSREGEPKIRSAFSRLFYKLINKMSEIEIVDGAVDFRMMKREMVDAIVSMCEYNRFSKGIFGWIGFRTKWLPFKNVERVAGETKWNFWKLFKYSIDGIVNFSQAPLSFASMTGLLFTVVAFLMVIFVFVRKLIFGDPVAGWASTICIVLFIGGVQLLCMGIMGQYLAKTYLEVKRRPHYIVAESNKPEIERVK